MNKRSIVATTHISTLKALSEVTTIPVLGIDTTVKSGGPELSPTWRMVLDYKRGNITEETYTEKFNDLMRISRIDYSSYWDKLSLTDHMIVFACYCASGDFCHRHLIVSHLRDYSEKWHDRQTAYVGEIKKIDGELIVKDPNGIIDLDLEKTYRLYS